MYWIQVFASIRCNQLMNIIGHSSHLHIQGDTNDLRDAGIPCSWTSPLQLSLIRPLQGRLRSLERGATLLNLP